MGEVTEGIKALLRRDPELARALAEVDRTLIRAALELPPLERLEAATAHLRGLRRFKRVAPKGS